MVQASGAEAGLHAAEHETDGRDEPSRGGVRAVERAVRILRAFTPERPWLTLAEIAEAAVVDKATARRMLLTLIGMDLVEQEPIGQRYALGLGVVALGASVPVTVDLRNVAAPHLAGLARETRAMAFLSILREDGAMCIERSHGNPPVDVRIWNVGESLPVNRGAAPRLLLAHLAAEERARRLARPLGAATAHTLTAPAALEADGALIRERGWAVAVDDIVEGVSALAAPVRDARGRVAAAVSVSGLTPQLIGQDGQPLTDALTRVRTAAAEISRQLQDMHWAR